MDANWKKYCRNMMRTWDSDSEEEKKEDAATIVKGEEAELSMEDQIAVYKHLVTRRKKRKAFDALMCMGCPLWHCTYSGTEAIEMAAYKLMLGLNTTQANFTEETMFGVASVLCRIGVRPRSTSSSALAPRVVANFMATLAYINFERDCYVCSYASDPIPTAGAMRVWHALKKDGLAEYILPRLEQLIVDEVLDTGGSGQVVATMLMLLAMDTCVMDRYKSPDYYQIVKFVRVKKFLEMLNFAEIQISYEGAFNEEKRPAFDEWMAKWKKWRMGFSHFVQLVLEPNEDTLWYLLGRRAAGILPRDNGGADLLIPMFTKDSSWESRVSLMLIFVRTRSEEMSIEDLQPPRHEFGQNPLSQIPIHDIIHIYTNVGNEAKDGYRFIRAEPLIESCCESIESNEGASFDGSKDEDESGQVEKINRDDAETDDVLFTLCFGSVCSGTYSFLSKEVAERLRIIATYPKKTLALVDRDLERLQDNQRRRKNSSSRTSLSETMSSEEVRKTTASVLAYEPRAEKKRRFQK
ncbi:hypothetical protein V7S43_011267 [Phytophthora oleae]|uniref:Uncharacterized protein n=1 Tax=Phytophthora oleae TaxID=2107226 RepID=A0ABD3FAE2_9STRA